MIQDKKWYKWIAWELLATLSNKPSYFASKRLERMVMFVIFCWITIGYVKRRWDELETSDIGILGGILLGASIIQAGQIRKDIKQNNDEAPYPPADGTPAV